MLLLFFLLLLLLLPLLLLLVMLLLLLLLLLGHDDACVDGGEGEEDGLLARAARSDAPRLLRGALNKKAGSGVGK